MRSIAVTPVVGLPTFTDWSQVVEIKTPTGVCIFSFSLIGQSASVFGRELVSDLEEESPKDAQGLYDLVLDLIERTRSKNCSLSIAAALVRDNFIDLAANDGLVLLKRDAKIGTLISQSEDTKVLTGSFEPGDVLVLATHEARQFIPELVQQFERGLTTEAVVSAILPALRSDEDLASASLAFVVALEAEEKQEAEVSIPEKGVFVRLPEVEFKDDIDLVETLEPPENTGQIESATKTRKIFPKKIIISTSKLIAKSLLSVVKRAREFLPSSAVYIRTARQSAWRRKIILVAAVLGLLTVVILGTRWWYMAQVSKANELMAPLKAELASAQGQLDNDPITARQRVEAVVAEFRSLAAVNEKKPIVGPKIAAALADAEQISVEVSGTKEVTELSVFYDLRLAQSDFIAAESHIDGKQGVFVDTEKKQAIVLNLETKQVSQLSLSNTPDIKATTVFNNNLLILAGGLYEIPFSADSESVELKPEGDSSRNGTFLTSFGSYAYILNPEKRNFYRYLINGSSVSDPVGWLVDPLDVSYDSITSIAIDGDVWFTTKEGELKKYSSGRKAAFETKGLPTPFSTPIYIFTSENLDNLFILEPAKNRVVLLDKSGVFVKEITSTSIATVTSMIVDSDGKTAYLSSGSLVYQIDLTQ